MSSTVKPVSYNTVVDQETLAHIDTNYKKGVLKNVILIRFLGQYVVGQVELCDRARKIHQIMERWLIRVQHL